MPAARGNPKKRSPGGSASNETDHRPASGPASGTGSCRTGRAGGTGQVAGTGEACRTGRAGRTRPAQEDPLDAQVERFHREMLDLVRKYLSRDRVEMTCCDVSVSQCHVLETLQRVGPATMNELAGHMHLAVSTVTRLIDPLVEKTYVDRSEDAKDRRIRVIRLTPRGKGVFEKSWKGLFASEKAILSGLPAAERESLIRLLGHLNRAVDCCCPRGEE